MDKIEIYGARTHNLKNINLIIPRNKLIVVTGLSGSGKSSLAFDTLYAEGQRRYIKSLSPYARQFLSLMEKPDVDHITGLSPAIAIEQKSVLHNPRSTVGTMTEILDYLRLFFSRIGEPRCPDHNIILSTQTISQMVDQVLTQPQDQRLMLLAPIIKNRKGEYTKILQRLVTQGYIRARIDNKISDISIPLKLDMQKKHTIEVVIDRFYARKNMAIRLAQSFESTLQLSGGRAIVVNMDKPGKEELLFSANPACPICGYSLQNLEPRIFSFNNPIGACPTCDGLGIQQYFDPNLIIQNKELSIAEGAIPGWDRYNLSKFKILCSLAKHLNFDINKPFHSLNEKTRHIILYGSDKKNIKFKHGNGINITSLPDYQFKGILYYIESNYNQEKSKIVRKKLAKYLNNCICVNCKGARLCRKARHVFVNNTNLTTILDMSISDAMDFFQNIKLNSQRIKITESILKEICNRLNFLINVGLHYLSLSRPSETLSGGEAQRIRLASQIGSGLVGVLYVLDEPSIGLHQRDNQRLLKSLTHLRNIGNTVLMVEHDEDSIRYSDHIIDIGPGAGIHGGMVVAEGNIQNIIMNKKSLTGQYLSGEKKILVPQKRIKKDPQKILKLIGANGNNLKNVTLTLPVGLFTCITGVSGSGKSTLISDTLFPIARYQLNGIANKIASYHRIDGLEYFNKVIEINQSPISRSPRSNPATYTGIFTTIRELFAGVPEARIRGYDLGRFSFNVRGGRCEVCQGDGVIRVKMHFLPDIHVLCDQCKGKRYNRETLEIKYKNKSIHEILNMSIENAYIFFQAIPKLVFKLKTLMDVGLSYIQLGQFATTLSGGESQRLKLSRELSKQSTNQTLYILDEPTIGLHFADIQQLLKVLHQLRDQGNTIVVIEHNLEVIKTADWIIDLGPEGGNDGGYIITEGTPENIVKCEKSYTAHYLKTMLKK